MEMPATDEPCLARGWTAEEAAKVLIMGPQLELRVECFKKQSGVRSALWSAWQQK